MSKAPLAAACCEQSNPCQPGTAVLICVAGAAQFNGAGKSTLIKMLTGETQPNEGSVWKHPNTRVAYVAQHAFHHLEQVRRSALPRSRVSRHSQPLLHSAGWHSPKP